MKAKNKTGECTKSVIEHFKKLATKQTAIFTTMHINAVTPKLTKTEVIIKTIEQVLAEIDRMIANPDSTGIWGSSDLEELKSFILSEPECDHEWVEANYPEWLDMDSTKRYRCKCGAVK